MSPEKRFELGDYVEVKDRIKLFYELYGQGRLVTTDVRTELGPDGVPRVLVEAAAYRTPDDPLPARGWSWMALPGTTPYTKGSELENTETSAWGRAIAALGILVDRSIASAQEVQNKSGEDARPQRLSNGDGGLTGIAEVGKTGSDFELRQTPDGMAIGFRLRGDKGGIKVVAIDPLATALSLVKDETIGQRVTCWGRISDETFTANKGKPNAHEVTYQVLTLAKIKTPTYVLPGEPGDVPAEPVEAESVPAFDDAELAAIDAAIDKATAA